MKKSWKQQGLAVALTAGLLLSPVAPALAADELSFDLDQIVVTATKTEKKIKDVPAAVDVITKADMDKRNIKRVDDALKIVPGVYVRQTKGISGSTDSITMRGFGSQKQVLILVDGQPLNDGYSGGVNLSNVPTENIDRIEVIKGPGSALYGSNAMGGVINIITKEKAKQETVIRLGSGSQGTESKSLYKSGSIGKLDYFLNAQSTSTDGYESDESYKTAKAGSDKAKNPGNNGMNRELYDAKLIYHLDEKSKLSVSSGSNRFYYFIENKADRGLKNEDIWALTYENKLNNNSSLKLKYNEKKLDSWYVSTNYDTKVANKDNVSYYSYTCTPSKTNEAELQYNSQLGSKDLITLGYAYKTEEADSKAKNLTPASGGWDLSLRDPIANQDIGGKTETKSIYLQDEHKVNEKTSLYLGCRYDDWRFYDGYTYSYDSGTSKYINKLTPGSNADSFNPKLGLVHKVNDKLTIRSSIGKAFRAPNVYELAKDWESSSGIIYKCNPDLKPEKSTNYEVGFDYQVNKKLLTRLNIYRTDLTDTIDKKTTKKTDPANTTGKDISQFINSGKCKINGLEIGLDKHWNDAWSSFINYTYTDAKIKESKAAPENVDKQVSYVPKNMFNIGISYNKGAWQGSITGNYASESNDSSKIGKTGYGTYESHFTVDTKLSYKLSDDTNLSLSVDNLFDKEYHTYYLSAPRTTYLELVKKF